MEEEGVDGRVKRQDVVVSKEWNVWIQAGSPTSPRCFMVAFQFPVLYEPYPAPLSHNGEHDGHGKHSIGSPTGQKMSN